MIELAYFPPGTERVVYQVLQFRSGEPWRIVDGDELLGSIEKLEGEWSVRGKTEIDQDLVKRIGQLIDQQNFNRLPWDIKLHWKTDVQEVIAQGDDQYLVICRPGIDFDSFERLFRECIADLLKDRWEICFKVYNAQMSADFEVRVKI
ncbi:hypothetical protein [Pedobacter nutrimenti]|jgi:hypothetical protein|uniref:Uncharacterized protein n=1 Tax=Pedobacter nutrimenti TaxID=1241337 RepID=A0A318UR57_9SPHI|nr:hypothetical protein [Pedobacter nutrimenti]PYF74049.1 hypothetical protein B0O44_104220 [Pedobacter nutrimenti]